MNRERRPAWRRSGGSIGSLRVENFGGDARGQRFDFGQCVAGGDAGFFHKRRIQNKGAAVDEGMIGDFEGFAPALRSGRAGDNFLVHLQVRLKIERFAGVPLLPAGDGGDVLFAEEGGVSAAERFVSCRGTGLAAFGDQFENFGGKGEERFAMEESEEIAIQGSVNLQAIAAVLFDVGVDEAGDEALAGEGLAELLGELWGEVGRREFRG